MYTVDVRYIVKAFYAADVPIVLWGNRGIGKSSIIKQLSKDLHVPFIDLRLATQEVSDLIGIPKVNIATKQTYWAKPEWFPGEDQPEGILFLDEMNRAQRDVIQAVFQLVLDKKIHTHQLPAGWRIISACNYVGAYDVRELDEAMMSRFGHVDVEASHHAVCDYGMENGWNTRVLSFLRSNQKYLMATHEETGEDAPDKYVPSPDPRRWEMCSNLLSKGFNTFPEARAAHLQRLSLQCVIGEAAARALATYREQLPTIEDILTGKATYKKLQKLTIDKPSDLNNQVEKICMEMTVTLKNREYNEEELKHLLTFMKDIDRRELVTGVVQRMLEVSSEGNFKNDRWVDDLLGSDTIQNMYANFLNKNKEGEN